MSSKKDAFFWLGCLAVLVLAFDIFANLSDWTELLWFCSVTTGLLAYSLFRKNALMMTICLVLAVPAQSVWVYDFILQLMGKGMGRTAMLVPCGPFIFWGSVVIHTFLIPVSLWGVWRLGFHRKALLWAMGYGAALLMASYYWTPAAKNVNCVFYHCDVDDPGGGYWAHFWFQTMAHWAVIVPVSFGIFRVLFMKRLYEEQHADHT
ncbi:MAG: hypothetical protein HQL22_06835 [Candidatus Omnitrophica bacterium]|nr:hypothetical protein [Candidatus Omnitrophota bacterium]